MFVIWQGNCILNKEKNKKKKKVFHGTLEYAAYQHLILCILCATFTFGCNNCSTGFVSCMVFLPTRIFQ